MFLYKKIIKTLIKKNISIGVAESCTGGKISYLIIIINILNYNHEICIIRLYLIVLSNF